MSILNKNCRQGFSLLEVLISVFVVLIGLLGVATMIPAGRYEILQARKADMGADLSRAVMNSVVTQISNGSQLQDLQQGKLGFFVVANDAGNLADRLKTGVAALGFQDCSSAVNDNRIFNGNDDVSLINGDGQMQVTLVNNEAIGTGHYSAFATIVPMGNGYWEVTGLAVYRYNQDSDKTNYLRGSYVFCQDNNTRYHWYKIDNLYTPARGSVLIDTVAGQKSIGNSAKYLGEIVGVCKKVVRIDSALTVN